ncbi:MAG: sigma-70 family RNA polymerase sigma factor [Planctomycetaceae bacterium]
MDNITRILSSIDQGDPNAADELLPLVYEELRKLAAGRLRREKPGQTLQATALVHEAWLRLVNKEGVPSNWNGRGHFFGAAAEAMRRILVEQARRKQRIKHGGDLERVELIDVPAPTVNATYDLLELDKALLKLEQLEPDKAQLVKLRYYAGLSNEEAAEALGISPTTASRYWAYSRAWLFGEIRRREVASEKSSSNS